MVDALYSLVDVNQRLDQLLVDPFYIRHLNMTILAIKKSYDCTFSIDNHVLDRICQKILPRIHHQVKGLTIEQNSLERIFLTVDYPQLSSLSLVGFRGERLFKYLTDNMILRNLLAEQITDLTIDIQRKLTALTLPEIVSGIVTLVLSVCKRLNTLHFCLPFRERGPSICVPDLSSTNCASSTLTTLSISVETFNDCLYLLDGRLNCLSVLFIIVSRISHALVNIDNTKQLPKLKYFSLTSYSRTAHYDDRVIPLLRRMVNLEELKLFVSIIRVDSTYIDGIQLHDEVLVYIPRLKKFAFSIHTRVVNKNIRIDLASNEHIRRSFISQGYGQVDSYVRTNVIQFQGSSHVYSLPYQFKEFIRLNNCFQGGIFDKVLYLTMVDSHAFEHSFFKTISQDFPFLKGLYIINNESQKEKRQSFILITFPHLTFLHLKLSHANYAEQFLYDKNTHLPCLKTLSIKYESLVMITNNFTNDATRATCAQLENLDVSGKFARVNRFYQYFPNMNE